MSFNGIYIFHLSIGVNEAAEQTIIPPLVATIHAFDAVHYPRSFILYIKLKIPHQKPSSTRPSKLHFVPRLDRRHFPPHVHGPVAPEPEERRGLPALALLKVRKQSYSLTAIGAQLFGNTLLHEIAPVGERLRAPVHNPIVKRDLGLVDRSACKRC